MENVADCRENRIDVVAAAMEVHLPPDNIWDVGEDEAHTNDYDSQGNVHVGFLPFTPEFNTEVILYSSLLSP